MKIKDIYNGWILFCLSDSLVYLFGIPLMLFNLIMVTKLDSILNFNFLSYLCIFATMWQRFITKIINKKQLSSFDTKTTEVQE